MQTAKVDHLLPFVRQAAGASLRLMVVDAQRTGSDVDRDGASLAKRRRALVSEDVTAVLHEERVVMTLVRI